MHEFKIAMPIHDVAMTTTFPHLSLLLLCDIMLIIACTMFYNHSTMQSLDAKQ